MDECKSEDRVHQTPEPEIIGGSLNARSLLTTAVVLVAVIAGLFAFSDRTAAQTYQSLCPGTAQADSSECAALKAADYDVRKATRAFGSTRFRDRPEYKCTEIGARGSASGLTRHDAPKCTLWLEAVALQRRIIEAVQALKLGRVIVSTVPTDTGLPVIELAAPERVESGERRFRITGLVGDDGSPPRIKVDGKSQPLFALNSAQQKLAEHTLAFDVELPATESGERVVVVEACDASGNCVAKRAVVDVIVPHAPAPTLAPGAVTRAVWPDGASFAALCKDTALADSTDCQGLGAIEITISQLEQRTQADAIHCRSGQFESGYDCRRWLEATERKITFVAKLQRLSMAQSQTLLVQADLDALVARLREEKLLATPRDVELPRLKIVAPTEVALDESGAFITGLVGDDSSPPQLRVNGEPVSLFELEAEDEPIAAHTFAFQIGIPTDLSGHQSFVLESCDAAENCIGRKVSIVITEPDEPNGRWRNFALIIGNNEYENLPDLKTAVNDATELAEVLKTRYAFEEEAITLLTNAGRRDILGAFTRLRRELGPDDRLLVYYAGHGVIDSVTGEGFWQPADAEPDEDFTWIDNGDIKRYVRGISARHVLVVADSCFSGTLTRGAPDYSKLGKDRFFAEIDSRFSRKVITSGGMEPVADNGTGEHSVFAQYFLRALMENLAPYVTSFELFNGLVRAVTNNSSQKPEYGTIAESGDDGSGDFTFILR